MKFFACLYILLQFMSCKNASTKPESKEDPADSIYYSYSPSYSNGYNVGDNKKLKIVTDIWKEIENGDIRKSTEHFADSVNFVFPEQAFKGLKDSVLNEVKKIRDHFQSLQTFVYSWMPVKSKDHNEDWVFIWGRHLLSDKKGKMVIKEIHEIWQFNENGKIKFVQQYYTQPS